MKYTAVIILLGLAISASAVQDSRVIGGSIATAGQFPYVAGLITRINVLLSGQCAGSILSTRTILTSASCVSGVQNAVVVMGGLLINNENEAGQLRITATQFIIHNGYMEDTLDFDVALVILPIPISFTDTITAVRLPNRRQADASFLGQEGSFMGWGRFGEGTSNSEVLRFATSRVITNLACTVSLVTETILSEHICTAGTDEDAGNGSPCQGDSGAPLTILDTDGITTQIGVFSFHSILGCNSGRAAVFTRMSAYLNWIEDNSDVTIED